MAARRKLPQTPEIRVESSRNQNMVDTAPSVALSTRTLKILAAIKTPAANANSDAGENADSDG